MKAALLFFLAVSPVFAQDKSANTAVGAACGAEADRFDVKTLKHEHPATQPDAKKGLVYFIEDSSNYNSILKPTIRAGLDGGWVGATHGSSYFYFSVTPGEHHLCASWQTGDDSDKSRARALLHFTAEAGHAYYLRVKTHRNGNSQGLDMDFEPVDSDEGQFLASEFSFSTFHPKK